MSLEDIATRNKDRPCPGRVSEPPSDAAAAVLDPTTNDEQRSPNGDDYNYLLARRKSIAHRLRLPRRRPIASRKQINHEVENCKIVRLKRWLGGPT